MELFKSISEVILTVLFSVAAIWAIAVSFRKRGTLFLQIVACGLGCMALGNIFIFSLNLTAPEHLLKEMRDGFNIGLLGFFGLFAFIFSASFGQIDGLGDDKSKALRKYRLWALIAPAVTLFILVMVMCSGIDRGMQVLYAILFLPAIAASYYNLKHLIIPDVELGILASIRKYNLAVLLVTVLVLASIALKLYDFTAAYAITNILAGIGSLVVFFFAKQGAERWLR